jgi:DamX protein
MGFRQDLRVVELVSQVELLERIQLLANFGSNLISVSGIPGAGKTWIAQRYLERWANEKNQSLLMCHPNQSEEQHRLTILNQLQSDYPIDPSQSLVNSLIAMLDEGSCNIVIVIDNAQLLADTLVTELWMVVLEAQSNPRWSISVILFGLPNALDTLLTRLSYGQENKPVELEIEPLSYDEGDRLFEMVVMRFVPDDMERQVRAAYDKVNMNPGEIMALGNRKKEKRVVVRSIIGSPFNIALLLLLLLLLIGGGYWWSLTQPDYNVFNLTEDSSSSSSSSSQSSDEPVSNVNSSSQLNVNSTQSPLPLLSPSSLSDPAARTAMSTDDIVQRPSTGTIGQAGDAPVELLLQEGEKSVEPINAEDDSKSLPPDVTSNSGSVGEKDTRKRVVITSEVVDALLKGEDKKEQTEAIENVVDETAAVALHDGGAFTKPTAITFKFGDTALKAMPERSYTLQLAAAKSLDEVQVFIEKYKIKDKVAVYPTVRNGETWYVVTYSNYATIQLARDAVDVLPKSIQKLGPWAKSLRQVQREIERGEK